MFDLEQAIAEWRQQMLAAGIKTPVPLEELEIHLREEIERQMSATADAHQAFEKAVQMIGVGRILKNEFEKTNSVNIHRIMSVGVGIITVFVGFWIVLMTVVQSRYMGTVSNEEARLVGMFALAFILGMALVIFGLILVFYGGRNVSWLPNAKQKHV